jgi:hypothetical protein
LRALRETLFWNADPGRFTVRVVDDLMSFNK